MKEFVEKLLRRVITVDDVTVGCQVKRPDHARGRVIEIELLGGTPLPFTPKRKRRRTKHRKTQVQGA